MNLGSPVVALDSCRDYDQQRLSDRIDRLMAVRETQPGLRSCAVLLKPNLITARYGPLPCTEAAFILAVARWFLDQGARVSIGDSPAFGSAAAVLDALGIREDLLGLGVRITDFRRVRQVKTAGGVQAGMAGDAMECDLLVNMPRVKAHAQVGITLAVKNFFGCLVGLRKPWWHMMYGGRGGRFSDYLVQLLEVLPDSLTLVDGVVAMHKNGPVHGLRYPLGLVACSSNPVAMDRALLEVLGVAPERSPLMCSCRRAELTGAFCSQLSFPMLTPSDLQAPGFRLPGELSPIRFNILAFIRGSFRRIVLRR